MYEYGWGTDKKTRPTESLEHAMFLRRLHGGWIRVQENQRGWLACTADDPILKAPWWRPRKRRA